MFPLHSSGRDTDLKPLLTTVKPWSKINITLRRLIFIEYSRNHLVLHKGVVITIINLFATSYITIRQNNSY